MQPAWIVSAPGDLDARERVAPRRARRAPARSATAAYYSTVAVYLAQCLYGRAATTRRASCARRSRDDARGRSRQLRLRSTALEGRVLSRRGSPRGGRGARSHAVELAETTDFLFPRPVVRVCPGARFSRAGPVETRLRSGDRAEARLIHEAKGDVAGVPPCARAPRRARRRRSPDRRRRALLTSPDGDRVPPGGDRAPRRVRAEVRQGGAHVRRRAPRSRRSRTCSRTTSRRSRG